MNRNKLIALAVALGTFFGPFYYLFIRNNGTDIVDSAFEMFMMLGWIIGMIVAFGIAVNEPFGKTKTAARSQAAQATQRKAA